MRRELRIVPVMAAVVLAVSSTAQAQAVRLKNDMIIPGKAVAIQAVSSTVVPSTSAVTLYPVTLIDDGMRRYYVPTRNVIETLDDVTIAGFDRFEINPKRAPSSRIIGAVGLPLSVTGFDERGQRVVTLGTDRGPIEISQVITEIRPDYMRVQSQKYAWEFGLSTRSIPLSDVDRLIRSVTDQQKQNDRFAIARFYVQAELYLQALQELEAIADDFPDLRGKATEQAALARELLAQSLLRELEHRRRNGQHELAFEKAREFPTEGMSASVLRQVREFLADYDRARDDGERAVALLGELQGQIEERSRRERLEAMRVEISLHLNMNTLDRLRPFLQQSEDATRSPEEKLAIAYSGWVLGEAKAIDQLDVAMNLWEARTLMLQYIRAASDTDRDNTLVRIMDLEGIGPATVKQLVPLLPPLIDTPGARPGEAIPITVDTTGADPDEAGPEVRYEVLLPIGYSPDRVWPMVVSLHAAERDPARELRWWGGTADDPLQSQRHGYIVIAPEYLDEGEKAYGYSPLSHYRVRMAVRDARMRFMVDSDRIFIAGHGSGGDAAFDMAAAHADLFAGAIPINGRLDNMVVHIWRNARELPWYIVSGQLDRDSFEHNANIINNMMKVGRADVTLVEYVGHGYESFYSEIHRLFEWMELYHREPVPDSFSAQVMRPNNNRFHWLKAHTLEEPGLIPGSGGRPKVLKGEIHAGADSHTAIQITSPARRNTVWLNSEMVDFNLRVKVRIGTQQKYNDFIESSIKAILDDVRTRGDRQLIYETRLEL